MKVGDLVARKWPLLDNGQRLAGIVLEVRNPSYPPGYNILVQWINSSHGTQLHVEDDLELINENR